MAFNSIRIKDHPQIRHCLAHIMYAIQELAYGNKKTALYELEEIEEFISWGDEDENFVKWCERNWKRRGVMFRGRVKREMQKKKTKEVSVKYKSGVRHLKRTKIPMETKP